MALMFALQLDVQVVTNAANAKEGMTVVLAVCIPPISLCKHWYDMRFCQEGPRNHRF